MLPEHETIIIILTMTDFDKLWDYSNPAETERKFMEFLPKAEKSQDISYYTQLLTQIARAKSLQKKFDEAHKTLDKAKDLIDENMVLVRIRYNLERGRTYNSSGVFDNAKAYFLEAYELAESMRLDFYTVDAAHMMAIVEKGDDSLKWNEIAMKHARASRDEQARNWLGSLYNNTGWTYSEMGNYDKALELFEKNVKWHEERKSKRQLIIAKWCVARTLRSLGKTNDALEMQKRLLDEVEEMKVEQDGYIFEEIGECLLLNGKTDEAKPFFAKAYDLLSKDIWLAANEADRLERMKSLSK